MENSNKQFGLGDFVSQSIVEITKGLKVAAEKLQGDDVKINPLIITESKTFAQREIQELDFDLCVGVSYTGGSETGMRVTVFECVSAGSKAHNANGFNNISRLHFKVPIAFPIFGEFIKGAYEYKRDLLPD